jgi:hypothetical protein
VLAEATDGLTGADLKRLVEDGKILFAHDRARQRPLASDTTDYFLRAIETVRATRSAMPRPRLAPAPSTPPVRRRSPLLRACSP